MHSYMMPLAFSDMHFGQEGVSELCDENEISDVDAEGITLSDGYNIAVGGSFLQDPKMICPWRPIRPGVRWKGMDPFFTFTTHAIVMNSFLSIAEWSAISLAMGTGIYRNIFADKALSTR